MIFHLHFAGVRKLYNQKIVPNARLARLFVDTTDHSARGIILFCQFLILFAGKHIHILDFGKKDEFPLSANGDMYQN